jgi:thioredoxin 1
VSLLADLGGWWYIDAVSEYLTEPPDLASLAGAAVLEFGTNWCGICRSIEPHIRAGLADAVPHLKVEDGPGRALGRSFRVKLWPTLIFLRDGVEVTRLVRPRSRVDVAAALNELLESAHA